jgi:hypothetical protein
MKLKVKEARDIFNGLSFLAAEPIVTHLLNFRLKTAILQVQPIAESIQKSTEEITKVHAELEEGRPVTDAKGTPLWKSVEDEEQATKAYAEILDSEVDLPSLLPLPWELLEKAKCSYLDKTTGARKSESLVIPANVLIALGSFIEGEPAAS